MKTNILVQYQGGGYNGCFWEWNYFYIDKLGLFHNIFSSGRCGINSLENAKKLLKSNDTKYLYNMSKEENIKEFVKENNVVNITGVLQFFEENTNLDVEFFVLCSECKCKITNASEIRLENWHGCGGIMSTADKLLCYECYGQGVCGCCDEYVGEDDVIYLGGEYDFDDNYMNKAARKMLDDGYSDVCNDCIGEQARQLEEQEFEDLRQQSFCTGKPDMFSGELRERRLNSSGGL